MSTIINATTTNGVVIQPDNSGSLVLQTNSGTTALTIDTSQNVGIGTTSPTAPLTIQKSGSVGINIRQNTSTDRFKLFVGDGTGGYTADENYIASNNTGLHFLAGGSGTTEVMRIDSSGNLGLGVTGTVGGNTWRFGSVFTSLGLGLACTNSSGNMANFYTSTSTFAGAITVSGSATSYGTSSDYRLKENVQPMTGALDKVALLKPVTYTWKSDGLNGQGFIAHELQAVVPDAVVGEKDAVNAEGNIQPQSVDTSFLVATLTAAIQEQQTIINDLKARIETLEAK